MDLQSDPYHSSKTKRAPSKSEYQTNPNRITILKIFRNEKEVALIWSLGNQSVTWSREELSIIYD